jgi:hypothetical protein
MARRLDCPSVWVVWALEGTGNGARLHFSPPTPPSREERIEKAAKKILGLRKDCLYCEDHGLCEAEISIVLTELMEGKP